MESIPEYMLVHFLFSLLFVCNSKIEYKEIIASGLFYSHWICVVRGGELNLQPL